MCLLGDSIRELRSKLVYFNNSGVNYLLGGLQRQNCNALIFIGLPLHFPTNWGMFRELILNAINVKSIKYSTKHSTNVG